MKDKIELLAPAGNMESFYTAVKNGADAVYLGGKLFSARSFADNFSIEDIRYVVRYAHIRGIKVYVTVNTLVSDNEFDMAIDFLRELYGANVDGVIIQDLGLASVARRMFKDLHLHASTQMTVYNESGVEFLKRLGFVRVVLARETSLREIDNIARKCKVDVEVFGHGALCISYSGQCLLSSMIGARSGNRGKCAQPCRLCYELMCEDIRISSGYLISPKDLCSLENIPRLVDSNISSLKIEGRMKTPEYVAVVTRIYRKYIDNPYDKVDECDIKDITQIFNRGGFTKGYFDGGAPNDMITIGKPKNWGTFLGEVVSVNSGRRMVRVKLKDGIDMGDGIEIWNGEDKNPGVVISQMLLNDKMVKSAKSGDVVWLGYLAGKIKKGDRVYKTSSKKLNQLARSSISGKDLKRVALCATVVIRRGMKPKVSIWDANGNVVMCEGCVYPADAINRPLCHDRVVKQMNKTGDTPYYFEKIDVDLSDGVVLPISEINNMRRSALEKLDDIRGCISDKCVCEVLSAEKYANDNSRPKEISLFFYKVDYDMKYWELGASRVYLPLLITRDRRYKDILAMCNKNNVSVYVHTPAVTREKYDAYIRENIHILSEFKGVMCGNIGTMEYLRGRNIDILCDYTMNVFNTYTAKLLRDEGAKMVTMSCEMTLDDINKMKKIDGLEKEIIAYGSIPVMTTEYCVVGDRCGGYKDGRCSGACRNQRYYLKDRKGEQFEILCDEYVHRCMLFNSAKIFLGQDMRKLRGVNSIRINVMNENFDEIKEIVRLNYDIMRGVVDKIGIDNLKKKGKYTKGHLYRMV